MTPWNVVVRKSRGTGDMRPIKHKSLNKNMSMSNRFACLQTQSNERDSVESDFPQLATSLDLVHNSPCHKTVKRWKIKSGPLQCITEDEPQTLAEVDRNLPREISSVVQIEGEWERIPIKIDSGAVDTVMPPSVANHFNLVETELSKNGPGFRAANGSPIKHFGQRAIRGVGDHYQPLNMTAQIADVSNTLGSVHQMIRAGNRVHFESGLCYIEHIRTGRRTPIAEKNGTFEVGIWVPRAAKQQCPQTATVCQSVESNRQSVESSSASCPLNSSASGF